jgi:hypothetical protein
MSTEQLVASFLKSQEDDGSRWKHLSGVLYGSNMFPTGREGGEKEYKRQLTEGFCRHLQDTSGHLVPITGPDRQGKIITLRKKDGTIKWSSWGPSSRVIQYLSDIGAAAYHAGISSIFDEGGILHPRHVLRGLIPILTAAPPLTTVSESGSKVEENTVDLLRAKARGIKDLLYLLSQAEARELLPILEEAYVSCVERAAL